MTDTRIFDKRDEWEDIDGKGNYKKNSVYCEKCGITCGVDDEGCCLYCGKEICGE